MIKKFKILLLNLPIPGYELHQEKTGHTLFADYIKAIVRKNKFTWIEVIELEPSVVAHYHNLAIAQKIIAFKPDLVGFSSYLWNVDRNIIISKNLRAAGIITVSGGPEVCTQRSDALSESFDYLIEGEGEYLFLELITAISKGKGPEVKYIKNKTVVNFNEYLPDYLVCQIKETHQPLVYLETERGCPFQCNFCAYGKSRNMITSIQSELFHESINTIFRNESVKEIYLLAPTFNRDRNRFREYLSAIIELNQHQRIKLFAEARPELLTLEDIKLLAKAGFKELELGIQSFQSTILKRVKRGKELKDLKSFVNLLIQEGITPMLDFIIGLPGDTQQSILATIEYLDQADLLQYADFYHLQLLPGTELYDHFIHNSFDFDPNPPYLVKENGSINIEEIKQIFFYLEQEKGISYQKEFFLRNHKMYSWLDVKNGVVDLFSNPYMQSASFLIDGKIEYAQILQYYQQYFDLHPEVFHQIYFYIPNRLPNNFILNLQSLLRQYPNYYDQFHQGVNYDEDLLFSKKIHLLLSHDSLIADYSDQFVYDYLVFPEQANCMDVKKFAVQMYEEHGAFTYLFKENEEADHEALRVFPQLLHCTCL
ncbi:MAG: B12-binding domain-containing radical SAM protein [Spirochaetes bacterium]|nr:B12-binding domain-containing radical SAM protein [Spirochaetota bacterium]